MTRLVEKNEWWAHESTETRWCDGKGEENLRLVLEKLEGSNLVVLREEECEARRSRSMVIDRTNIVMGSDEVVWLYHELGKMLSPFLDPKKPIEWNPIVDGYRWDSEDVADLDSLGMGVSYGHIREEWYVRLWLTDVPTAATRLIKVIRGVASEDEAKRRAEVLVYTIRDVWQEAKPL